MRKIAPVVVALAVSSWSAWTSLPTIFPGPIWGISVLTKGWTGLCNGAPYVSSDHGSSWVPERKGLSAGAYLMVARQMRDTVVAFGSGTFWRSVDFGANWTRWDEGYVPGPLSLIDISFEVGDTTCMMMMMTETGPVVWKRTPGARWKRVTAPESLETHAAWTGKAFAARDRKGGMMLLSPSDSVWRTAPEGFPALETTVWHDGKWWGVNSNQILSSSDSGAIWVRRLEYKAWTHHLASISGGIIGIGQDSMMLVRTGETVDIRMLPQPEQYGTGFLEDGKRWFFLGEEATWISDDAGAHWSRGGIPGMGKSFNLVATSQGIVRQDEFDPSVAQVTKDMSTWSEFALPEGTRKGGIDTAAGTVFAIGEDRVWTLDRDGWSRDSMHLATGHRLVASMASDGKMIWIANGGGLYSRPVSSRTWILVDTLPNPFKPDVMRFWNGILWATANEYGKSLDMPVASTSGDSVRWKKVPITCGNAYALVPTHQALWIGTDKGLFRTRDGVRFEHVVVDSVIPEGIALDIAVQGDTVAISMLSGENAPYEGRISTSVSIDGGTTWSTREGDAAVSFVFTPGGLVAGMYKGGLWRWTNGSDAVVRTPSPRRDFAWRPGHLEWNTPDARSLEILDACGRILSRIDVAPGMHGIALPPASTLRIARLTGPTGTRAIAVPPLR